ncbi:MAG: site-specific integrase [Chloroflexi bacterium]|nr:site-specific integrase [Chloroflexota bacterium]
MSGKSSRRAPGEGGLYQRADGRWEGRITTGYSAEGKRRRRKVVARTKREAAERLEVLKRELDAGLSGEASKWTVADWLELWLKDEAAATVRPRTLAVYTQIVRSHLIPALGHYRLRKLEPSHVRGYFLTKIAAGLQPRTVGNHHIVLRRALEIATRYQYVERNVDRLVSAPRAERYESHPLDQDEVGRFLTAARGHPQEALFVLAASTGMRQGEVLGLAWPQVDLDGGYVRISAALSRYGDAFHRGEPKTAKSRRTIAIPLPVVEVLRHHRDRQTLAERRGRDSGMWLGNEWDLVFTGDRGQPLGAHAVYTEFVRLLKSAGVRPVRFHDLRHGAATFLLAQGVDMRVVQEILGHAQISMTADLYSHVVPELQREAANRIGDVLFATR